MRNDAPPQFSPDGHWWWTGQRWVPVFQAAPPGRSQASPTWSQESAVWQQESSGWQQTPVYGAGAGRGRRRTPPVLWLALIAMLALLVLALMPSATGWIAQQVPGIGAAPVTAPSEPTPAPVQSPAAPGEAAAVPGSDGYRQAIAADASSFQTASQAVGDRCSPAALADGTGPCRSALRSMDATVQRIQTDLNGQPVPTCFQPAARELQAALTLYHQGIQQELDGLDRNDPLAVVRGAGTLSQANGRVHAASTLLPGSC
jgi:hypothetical protein